jgi:hypothetical protein
LFARRESRSLFSERQAEFWFDSAASELEIPLLGLTPADTREEISTELQESVNKFLESPAAQLEKMKKLEVQLRAIRFACFDHCRSVASRLPSSLAFDRP